MPPLSSCGRCEWQVPRPRLPPALEAGLAVALGRGSSLAPRPQVGPGSKAAEALRVTVVQAGECTSREAIGGGVCGLGWSGPPRGWSGRPPGASERRSQEKEREVGLFRRTVSLLAAFRKGTLRL